MKTILLTILILISALKISHAQDELTFSGGLKTGIGSFRINVSNNNYSSYFTSSSQSGFIIGAWTRLSGKVLMFQPEIYYYTVNVQGSDLTSDRTQNIQTINMPFLVGAKFGDKKIGGRIYGGPEVEFTVSTVNETYLTNTGVTFSNLLYNSTNFATTFGVGLDVSRVSLDFRYSYGISTQYYSYNHSDQSAHVNILSTTLAFKIFEKNIHSDK